MRIPKRDPQQFRVYKWERSLSDWAGARATDDELRTIVGRCCALYRVPIPTLALVTKDKRDGVKLDSSYQPGDHHIELRPRHRHKWDAIHEAAHAITDWIIDSKVAHGPEWFGVYLILLSHFKVMPLNVLRFSADRAGLEYAGLPSLEPNVIRYCYKIEYAKAKAARKSP